MDNYRHKGLRQALIRQLRAKGISNESVLSAMGQVPRHLFLDKAFEDWAYKDQAFPIRAGQTISQPYTVAYQTTLLEPKKTDKILEIGTGSGYQAAVLSFLCRRIYSIERQKELFDYTSQLLNKIGFSSVRTLFGDGYKGSPRFAPFDKIIITAGAELIPEDLKEQLKVGGFIVAPLGLGDDKTMVRMIKLDNGTFKTERYGAFRFVPFMQGTVS